MRVLRSKQKKQRRHQAQTFVEYTVLIGIVTGLLIAMSTMIRRGTQEMVKVVSDQIGNQLMADQSSDPEAGRLINTASDVFVDRDTKTQQRLDVVTYNFYRDITQINTTTITNSGFQPNPE